MQYRTTIPQEQGFDTEYEETAAVREFIQGIMEKSGPGDLLDSILVVVNICEQRALVSEDGDLHRWYISTSQILRRTLDLLAMDLNDYCPAAKLENPMLYFPQVERYQ
jgi:hypothetical protein